MNKIIKRRIGAAALACAISLTMATGAIAAPIEATDHALTTSTESVVSPRTGVPDYICDEGAGQHAILSPSGCHGQLYVHMDGRYQGHVNMAVLRLRAQDKRNGVGLHEHLNTWCTTNSSDCGVTLDTLSIIVDAVFHVWER